MLLLQSGAELHGGHTATPPHTHTIFEEKGGRRKEWRRRENEPHLVSWLAPPLHTPPTFHPGPHSFSCIVLFYGLHVYMCMHSISSWTACLYVHNLPSVAERQAGAHNPCLFLALADCHVISTLCPACPPNFRGHHALPQGRIACKVASSLHVSWVTLFFLLSLRPRIFESFNHASSGGLMQLNYHTLLCVFGWEFDMSC